MHVVTRSPPTDWRLQQTAPLSSELRRGAVRALSCAVRPNPQPQLFRLVHAQNAAKVLGAAGSASQLAAGGARDSTSWQEAHVGHG